jgi:hypothetical protein
VFVHDDGNVPNMEHITNDQYTSIDDNVIFTPVHVCKVLRGLKSSFSAGLDELPAIVLKTLSHQLSSPLSVIFQQSFQTGKLPDDWLKAKIRPIFKKGSRTDAANYRPISLTSVGCKAMERVIKDFLLDHLRTNNIITPSQHGFLAKKSTETQLLECVNDWTGSLNRHENVDVFYMDISKAFDVVSHPKLLYKLKMYKITGHFFNWIESF